MADHRAAIVLQTLLTMIQLLYHNHQQQVDMENYMTYLLLNPPRRITRRARHMYYSVSSGSSALVWTDTFLEPIPCGRETFLISTSVRFRLRVDGALFCSV
ncbi:hypothetical protein OYC64_018490 [Pagothenia borchgrevinki]|uniref:Secreted protein n=1 Tax=Pagothenia borchgrevinki TaxID=8213 RepID=A0ABD2GQ47_PAGBO